jgi:hypothetical protein
MVSDHEATDGAAKRLGAQTKQRWEAWEAAFQLRFPVCCRVGRSFMSITCQVFDLYHLYISPRLLKIPAPHMAPRDLSILAQTTDE